MEKQHQDMYKSSHPRQQTRYNLRGMPINPEQAKDIITKLECDRKCKLACFKSDWFNDNLLKCYGFVHPDGAIGEDSKLSDNFCLFDIITDLGKLSTFISNTIDIYIMLTSPDNSVIGLRLKGSTITRYIGDEAEEVLEDYNQVYNCRKGDLRFDPHNPNIVREFGSISSYLDYKKDIERSMRASLA